MKRKVTAFLLSLVLAISACALPLAASAVSARQSAPATDGAVDVPDYTALVRVIRSVKNTAYSLTGMDAYKVKIFDFDVDETLDGINDSIYQQTGLDFSKIYLNLPDTADDAEMIGKIFSIDRIKLQELLNAKAADLKAEHPLSSAMVRFFSVWMGVIDHVEAVCEPVEGDPELVRLTADIVYRDGRTDKLRSDIYYNIVTHRFQGADGKTALLGFNLDVGTATLTTGTDGPHRFLGYTILYDLLAEYTSVFLDFNTERFYFNYDDKEWLIQLWKGRYIVANGGEVGVYNRPESSNGLFYNCALDDPLDITLDITRGDDVILHLPKQNTWWASGYKLSDVTYDYHTFHFVTTITMKDSRMLHAFVQSVAQNPNVSYSLNGYNVTLYWD